MIKSSFRDILDWGQKEGKRRRRRRKEREERKRERERVCAWVAGYGLPHSGSRVQDRALWDARDVRGFWQRFTVAVRLYV